VINQQPLHGPGLRGETSFGEVRSLEVGVLKQNRIMTILCEPFYLVDIDNYREKHRLLLNALRHVESSFIMPAPIGDGGLSIGPLQIRFPLNILSEFFYLSFYVLFLLFPRIFIGQTFKLLLR